MLTKIQNVQGNNNSFQALKIKNPQKMPTEMLEALLAVKNEFVNFPNASVKLKNSSRIGIDTIYNLHSSNNHNFGRYQQSSLIFDIGKNPSSKLPHKFTISSQRRHTGSTLDNIFKQIIDALPFSSTALYQKGENLKDLTNRITKEEVSGKIKNLIKAINDRKEENLRRKKVLRSLS